ncbi:MAG: MMPL family transporter [Bacteroidales bacterium]|nr:MMPL family transporter [Bacteroidales bacterium]
MEAKGKENIIVRINNWFEHFGEFVVKRRIVIILLTFALIISASFGLKHLKIGLDLDKYFTEGDPILVNKQLFTKTFGNNDFVGVLVDADSVFDRNILKVIRELSHELRDSVPFAKEVISLTDINYVMPVNPMKPTAQSVFNTSNINIDSISDKQLAQIVKLFDKRVGIKGKLYSHDYKQTWIVLKLENYPPKAEWKNNKAPIEYVGKIAYEIVDKYNKKYAETLKASNFKLTAAGSPIIAYRRNAESLKEMTTIISFAAVIAVLLIILLTRSFKATVGTVVSVGGALLIVFGIKGFMRETVDSAFMLIPILLTIAVAVAYAIHLNAYYKKILEEDSDKKHAVVQSIKKNGWPILFASFTTIVSLASFITVPITTIQWAGTTAALSIFVVYILLMFFYPAVLALGKSTKVVNKSSSDKIWDTLLIKLSNFVMANPKTIIGGFAVGTVIMLAFCFKVEVNLHPKKMFGVKMPHAKDMVYVSESKIATNYNYNIMLKGGDEGFFKNLENAKKIAQLDSLIMQSKLINNVTALPSKVGDMHQALRNDNPKFHKLPESQTAYNAIIKKLEDKQSAQMRAWVTEDYSTSQIFVELPDFSSGAFVQHIDSIKAKVEELFPKDKYPNFSSHFTGYAIQFSKMNQYVTLGLVQSFGLSLIIVFILMSLAFGSIRIGMVAMLPNTIPVIFVGGMMGIFGLPLEFVTMTIAPMVLGLAVDNTIHFINYTKLEYLQTHDYDLSIRNTYRIIGQALMKSSLILCCTLITFTFAKMNNMVNMGILTVTAIIVATLADVMLTPTLIRLTKPFKKL